MEIPSLPRVKHGELQSIVEGTIEICKGLGALQPAMDKLLTIAPAFSEAVLKTQASAKEKDSADDDRDGIYSGAFYYSKSLTYFPFPNPDATSVAIKVWEIFEDNGLGIIRLPYNEESSAIDNRLNKLKKLDLNPLNQTMLQEWLTLIEQANEKFKKMALEFNEDKAYAASVAAATTLAPDVRKALEGLFMMLTTFTQYGNDAELLKAYDRIVTLLNSFR